jgi:hypothetical protein
MKVVFIALLISLFSSTAFAEDHTCPYKPEHLKVIELDEGDIAPYQGYLFGVNSALGWARCLRWYKQTAILQEKKQHDLCEAEKEYLRKSSQIKTNQYKELAERNYKAVKALEKENMKLRETHWYSNPFITAALGFGTGVVTFFLITR